MQQPRSAVDPALNTATAHLERDGLDGHGQPPPRACRESTSGRDLAAPKFDTCAALRKSAPTRTDVDHAPASLAQYLFQHHLHTNAPQVEATATSQPHAWGRLHPSPARSEALPPPTVLSTLLPCSRAATLSTTLRWSSTGTGPCAPCAPAAPARTSPRAATMLMSCSCARCRLGSAFVLPPMVVVAVAVAVPVPELPPGASAADAAQAWRRSSSCSWSCSTAAQGAMGGCTQIHAFWCMSFARVPLRCETSDAPGSWALVPLRCPHRRKSPPPHTVPYYWRRTAACTIPAAAPAARRRGRRWRCWRPPPQRRPPPRRRRRAAPCCRWSPPR